MHFQNLTDVHTRRYTQWVQYDVYGTAICQVRHVFYWQDARNHTFVTMSTRHFVTRLQAAFDGDKHFHHFLNARLQFVALSQFFLLDLVHGVGFFVLLSQTLFGQFQLFCQWLIGQTDIEPFVFVFNRAQILFADHSAFNQTHRTTVGGLTHNHAFDTVKCVVIENAHLVVQVFAVAFQFSINDGLSTFVTFNAFTGEHLYVDHRTAHACRHAQWGVFYVRGFFTEDGTQQFFFWGQLGFTFRCYLAYQHVASFYFSTDVHNTCFIQTVLHALRQVRDIAGDFFCAQFGIARHHIQFFDVDGGIAVFCHHFFRNQNRVFVVVTIPRHEGDGHVLTQSQFAQVGRSTVGHHVTTSQHIAFVHNRTLVDVGWLVRTGVFHQVVNVYAHFTSNGFFIVYTNHHATCVYRFNHTATARHDSSRRVNRHRALNTCTYQWFVSTQARHSLTLHVGAHQCTVGVIVFQEWNQWGCNWHDLTCGHVHVLNAVWCCQNGFAFFATSHQFVSQCAFFIQFGIGLCNHIATFFNRRQVIDLVGYFAINHTAVWGFQETIFIGTRIHRQRVDQTNVWTLWCFNRTHTTIMGWVYVTHFKACTFTCQTAGAQSRYTAFVRHFWQWVGLVHELRQLARAKELFNRSRNRFRIDQIMWHQVVWFSLVQTLFNGTLNTSQARTELVFSQLTYWTHTTVTQVIDVVYFTVTIAQFNQSRNRNHDVFIGQDKVFVIGQSWQVFNHRAVPQWWFLIQFVFISALVEFHATNAWQVIAVVAEEQTVKQLFYRIFGRWLTRTHHAVNGHTCLQLGFHFINAQGIGNIATLV